MIKDCEILLLKLKNELGENLASVVLYGSAVSKDETKFFSNINLLVLLKRVDVFTLDKLGFLLKNWNKKGYSLPSIFSEHEFQNSLDVFPLEFLDIQSSHQIFFGNDPFSGVHIELGHFRHQLEFELRAKLLTLRQRYLECFSDSKKILDLLAQSLSSITSLYRGVLRLKNLSIVWKKQEVWYELNKIISLDLEALEAVLQHRNKEKHSLLKSPQKLFERYIKNIDAVIQSVDKL
ncbi:MAG: hypothetical protein ACKVQC_03970 [Elusimicrobiota bacterium]